MTHPVKKKVTFRMREMRKTVSSDVGDFQSRKGAIKGKEVEKG